MTMPDVTRRILNAEFSWPQDLTVSDEAKDLVGRLLKMNPLERLGAGKPCSPNDISILLKHPFFAHIPINSLENACIPI